MSFSPLGGKGEKHLNKIEAGAEPDFSQNKEESVLSNSVLSLAVLGEKCLKQKSLFLGEGRQPTQMWQSCHANWSPRLGEQGLKAGSVSFQPELHVCLELPVTNEEVALATGGLGGQVSPGAALRGTWSGHSGPAGGAETPLATGGGASESEPRATWPVIVGQPRCSAASRGVTAEGLCTLSMVFN